MPEAPLRVPDLDEAIRTPVAMSSPDQSSPVTGSGCPRVARIPHQGSKGFHRQIPCSGNGESRSRVVERGDRTGGIPVEAAIEAAGCGNDHLDAAVGEADPSRTIAGHHRIIDRFTGIGRWLRPDHGQSGRESAAIASDRISPDGAIRHASRRAAIASPRAPASVEALNFRARPEAWRVARVRPAASRKRAIPPSPPRQEGRWRRQAWPGRVEPAPAASPAARSERPGLHRRPVEPAPRSSPKATAFHSDPPDPCGGTSSRWSRDRARPRARAAKASPGRSPGPGAGCSRAWSPDRAGVLSGEGRGSHQTVDIGPLVRLSSLHEFGAA